MSLRKMQVGKKYIVGDGYGYDKVECLAINLDEFPGCYTVKIKYDDTGTEDYFFESDDYHGLYVEEVS